MMGCAKTSIMVSPRSRSTVGAAPRGGGSGGPLGSFHLLNSARAFASAAATPAASPALVAASIAAAAKDVASRYSGEPTPLYGLCNNAGVGFGRSIKETLATNFYGSVNVCDSFLPLLDPAN